MPSNLFVRHRTAIVWALSGGLALLGNYVLWDAGLGINWGVWVGSAVVALAFVSYGWYGRVTAPLVAAGGWAIVLAFGVSVTTQSASTLLLLMATFVLLAMALVTASQPSLDAFMTRTAILAPLQSVRLMARGTVAELAGPRTTLGSRDARPAIRGALITAPVVAVLFIVLADADPLFGTIRDRLALLIPDALSARVAFFLALFGATLGACGSVSRGVSPPFVGFSPSPVKLGPTERRVLLMSVTILIWLFVASAIASQWADPAASAGTGITYAEYAHRGFGELSVAATLVVAVTLAAERFRTQDDTLVRRASFAALLAVGVMLGIAFIRILRYEWAYGYTLARVYAQGYMIVVGCALGVLALEIARRIPRGRFAYYTLTAVLIVLTGSIYGNTEEWIVNRNIDRYRRTGQLDVKYLTQQLSADAIPALASRAGELHNLERDQVMMWLRCDAPRWVQHDNRWFTWNIRITRGARALRIFNAGPACTKW